MYKSKVLCWNKNKIQIGCVHLIGALQCGYHGVMLELFEQNRLDVRVNLWWPHNYAAHKALAAPCYWPVCSLTYRSSILLFFFSLFRLVSVCACGIFNFHSQPSSGGVKSELVIFSFFLSLPFLVHVVYKTKWKWMVHSIFIQFSLKKNFLALFFLTFFPIFRPHFTGTRKREQCSRRDGTRKRESRHRVV